jgi:hypothetical protein
MSVTCDMNVTWHKKKHAGPEGARGALTWDFAWSG